MIRSITKFKPPEEVERLLADLTNLFIVGCGTCVTLTNTGGVEQVAQMASELEGKGKVITGTTVVPVACDDLSYEILQEHRDALETAEGLLIMTCAFGVQSIGRQMKQMVIPALDTVFVGKETGPGKYDEICRQCGECIIGETGGICPVTSCHKNMVNGPCGGTNDGMCEIGGGRPCAWTQIYNRLKELDKVDLMRRYQGLKNHNAEAMPGTFTLQSQ